MGNSAVKVIERVPVFDAIQFTGENMREVCEFLCANLVLHGEPYMEQRIDVPPRIRFTECGRNGGANVVFDVRTTCWVVVTEEGRALVRSPQDFAREYVFV